MHSRHLSIASITLLLAVAVAQAADRFETDAVHSSIVFKIKHMNTGDFWGRFNKISGQMMFDEADPGKIELSFTVPIESLDTNHAKRDSDLKGSNFFSAKEFPTITFKSKSVKSAGENKYEVSGELTMHGQTKPLTITLERTGPNDTQQGRKIGISTTFTIKRTDFGMAAIPGIGDDVEVHVGIEAKKT